MRSGIVRPQPQKHALAIRRLYYLSASARASLATALDPPAPCAAIPSLAARRFVLVEPRRLAGFVVLFFLFLFSIPPSDFSSL
jgi:hypothetical protein